MPDKTKKKRARVHGYFSVDGKLMRADTMRKKINAAEALRQQSKKQADLEAKADKPQELRNDNRKGSAAGSEFISPPFDLWQFAKLLEVSGPQYRAVTAKALDSVGKGWKLVQLEDGSDADGEILRNFFKSPTKTLPKMSMTEILTCLVKDFETVGNYGLEVVLNPDGTPKEINHLQGKTLRVKDNFEVIAQVRSGRRTYFKTWGAEKEVDMDSGVQSENIVFPRRGNTCIYRRKYHPMSDWYGIPDILSELGSVALDVSARDFNIDFFENGGIPAYVVIVKGGELDEDTETYLTDFFHNEMKGSGNAHRTMTLTIPQSDIEVEIKAISTDIKDGHFRNLRNDNRDAVLSANGVPPIRAMYFQSGILGRDASKKADEIYRDSTIEPIQNVIESMINEDIIQGMFEISGWAFKLKNLELIEREPTANIVDKLSRAKIATKNELRRVASDIVPGGLEDIEGGDDLPANGAAPPFGTRSAEPNSWRKLDYSAEFSRCRHIEYDELEEDLKRGIELKVYGVKQADIIRAQVRRQSKAVNAMAKGIEKVLNAQKDLVMENFDRAAGGSFFKRSWFGMKAKPVSINAVLDDIDGTTQNLEQEIEAGREEGVALGARASASTLGPQVVAGIDVVFNLDQPEVRKFLTEQSEKFAKDITRTTTNRIRNTLERGIRKGESNRKLADRVSKVFDTTKARAKMIARTETADAYNFGIVKSSADRGIVFFDVFDVGGPGDDGCVAANGKRWSAEVAASNRLEHPNCVRAFTPVPKGDL